MDNLEKTTFFRPERPQPTPPGSGCARITIFDGANDPRHIDLNSFGKPVLSFGREASNDICISSAYVSRRHGQFRYMDGRWLIEDIGSKNGLLFNGMSIPRRVLCDNDTIRIDDGVESTVSGVLFVFSGSSDSVVWKTLQIAQNTEITIGRDQTCMIHLNHVGVSRLHARIVKQGNQFFIIDNNSTNGIWINGHRLQGKAQLHEKDVITITNSRLIFSSGLITYCTFNKGIRVEASHIIKKVENGKKTICNDVSMKINPCELVAIIGGSGAGKSTVMNCISGYNKPTSGQVMVNGTELYSNFESIKEIIGYVPQQDIVFDNLSVYDMLKYTAKLRLPKDIEPEELDAIIMKVIDTVELTPHKSTRIKRLSGGQRKRASIAVELISDPTLFFLDEPASGLDPGTERNLMRTLKSMSVSGKTIIFVTHSTLNLRICDKIVFMGTGGKLCFMGSYDEALKFFEVDDLVDVYNMITDNSDYWSQKYNSQRRENIASAPTVQQQTQKKKDKHSWLRQMMVLSKRNLHIIVNDRARVLLLLLQAPLLGILISLVVNDETIFYGLEMTQSIFFALACAALWVGIMNSIQEICKERVILRREYMTGVNLSAYIISKMTIMGLVCLIQSLLLTVSFTLLVECPSDGVMTSMFIEIYLGIFMTAYSSTAMGIFVSALFKNADRAMTVAPILLLPQLLFSGVIFELGGASENISRFINCRYSMEMFGTSVNLNKCKSAVEITTDQITATDPKFTFAPRELNELYTYTTEHYLEAVGMLAVFIAAFTVLAIIAVRNVKNDK